MTPFCISAARFLLPCLLAVGYCLLPNVAWAEGRCPPGMFETGSRDFIGCAPIPNYDQGGDDGGDDSGSTPSRPHIPMKPGYMAAAHHADTSSVWITVGHRSLDAAKKGALDGCNRATRGGCTIAEAFDSWGSITVAIDAMSQVWIKVDPYQRNAPRWEAMRDPAVIYCRQNSFGCEFLGSKPNGLMPVDDDPNADYSADYFPKGALTRNHWALVARPTKTPTAAWQNKSWLISGRQGSVAARKEVLDRCQADAGVVCAISTYAVADNASGGPKAGGQLVHFVDSTGRNHWTSAVPTRAKTKQKKRRKNEIQGLADAVTPQERADAACPSAANPCRVIATYDAATPRMQIVEDAK
ncbi:MAG: hypothetical protein JHD35_15940 [Sphingopyxis sp.]|nr:hypothetical protein [Sphingopyxis sp.]